MDIKFELLAHALADCIRTQLLYMDLTMQFDPDQMADTVAISALSDIQKVIQDEELSDFDAIEQIVCIFEKYKLDSGFRHDF